VGGRRNGTVERNGETKPGNGRERGKIAPLGCREKNGHQNVAT
jgi:hypothetical protein